MRRASAALSLLTAGVVASAVLTHGMMGRTPNIDSIAADGILFTDHFGQPSCTAGRAAFIMGQLPVRTGETTVGIPGSPRGMRWRAARDPSFRREWAYDRTSHVGESACSPTSPDSQGARP